VCVCVMCLGAAGSTTRKPGRNHRHGNTASAVASELSCLLQPMTSSTLSPNAATRSKQTVAGGGAGTMPLLSVPARPVYEMPPSYETACSSVAMPDRDLSVCTITAGSNPSAVAYHCYPGGALQLIPDKKPSAHDSLYQNNVVVPSSRLIPAGDWRCPTSNEFGAGAGGSLSGRARSDADRTLTMAVSPTQIQAMHHQCVGVLPQQQFHPQHHAPVHHHHPGLQLHQQIPAEHQHHHAGGVVAWQPAPSHRRMHHYPTPPSQHSHASLQTPHDAGLQTAHDAAAGPPALMNTAGRVALPIHQHPEQFLTPSPDSPGQWSSSSPHSGQSDWSEGISSPAQAGPYQHQLAMTAPNHRLTQGSGSGATSKDTAVFLVHA